jgi:hypothetical protein
MRAAPGPSLPLLLAAAASVGCLAAAYVAAGQLAIACLVVLPGALLVLNRRPRGSWVSTVFLVLMTIAAAAGAPAGAPALLLVAGAAFALAAWDIAGWRLFLRAGAGPGARHDRRLLPLLVAVGLGLLAAAGGRALSVRIPFALMLLLVAADLACLCYVFFSLSGKGPRSRRPTSF